MSARGPVPPDPRRMRAHRLRHAVLTLVLLAGMAGLLAACGWIVAGWQGAAAAFMAGSVALLVSARLSPRILLGAMRARPLPPGEAPELWRLMRFLAARAGLERVPALWYVSHRMPTAITVGTREQSAIALTSRLLEVLDARELAAVLAHELSHIRHNDLWIMGLAAVITRLARTLSMLGIVLLLFNLPLVAAGAWQVPWLLVLLLVFAPTIEVLLLLALARTREFDADLDAVRLTGDAEGLASALTRIEQAGDPLGSLVPGAGRPGRLLPGFLRSHPETSGRVRRLRETGPSTPFRLPGRQVRHRRSMLPETPPPRRSRLRDLID